jgi:hypothetical protein
MKPHPYLILVEGDLRATERIWLADFVIRPSSENRTALSGNLDQSALHGAIRRLQHLSLEVVEVRRTCEGVGSQHLRTSPERAS